MNQQRSEQGGILSFVIIGTVLALLLVGGIWLAKFQARTVRTAGDITTSETQSTAQDTPSVTDTSPDSSTSSGTNSSDATSNTQSSPDSSSNSPSAGTSVPVSGPSTTEALPSTGPSTSLVSFLVIASSGVGAYVYAQSRQRLRRSALK